jgi:hypothetical protein
MKELEAKRKAKSHQYFLAKRRVIALRRKAEAEVGGQGVWILTWQLSLLVSV